jgi:plasmid stability protein
MEGAMGQVIVRNLDDAVIETHRRRAKARGVSLEQELRDVLGQAAKPSKEEILREMREIAAMTPELPPGRQRTPAEVLIRESRDSR